MSTPTLTHRRARPGRTPQVTWPRVLRSEWIKLSSLRSTRITLAVSFVLMAGVGLDARIDLSCDHSSVASDRFAGFRLG